MLNFILSKLIGKKTFLSLVLLLAHQGLKAFNMDVIPDEQLSQFVDTLLIILAGVFKHVGNKREIAIKRDMELLSKANKTLINEITKPAP